MTFNRLYQPCLQKLLRTFQLISIMSLTMTLSTGFLVFIPPASSRADEILDTVHSHYKDQVQRIHDALESGKKEAEQKETLSDARRTVRWIFEEPHASENEGRLLNARISKEFHELGIPVIIRPVPVRPFIFQRFTDHSISITDFENNTILVKTTLPFLQDGKMKRARTEAILLAALLLRDQILSLPVREHLALKKDLPAEALLLHGPLALTILNRAITPQGFLVRILPLAAGGGIVQVRMQIPIPLHLGKKTSPISAFRASPPTPPYKNLGQHPLPTGLILDARQLRLSPFRDIMIASAKGEMLVKPDDGRDSGSLPFGWAAFTDTPSPDLLNARVGVHPLTIRPEALIHHQVFLLSRKDARKVTALFQGTPLLKTGHILIRLAASPYTVSQDSSPSLRRPQ